jgi:sulfite exporter TauE/SafE
MMEAGYALAFTTGLLGGFGHCIGMCGPLVASYSFRGSPSLPDRPSIINNLLPHLFYNIGRITTYMFIGAVMGLTGSFVNVAGRISGFQNTVAIIAGLFMIFMGLSIAGIAGGMAWLERHNNFILKLARNILQGGSPWQYYPLGALFGFLPCGLSYTLFIAAAGTGNFLSGMFTMFFFGMGTLPALLLFGIISGYMNYRFRAWVYKAAGIVVMLTGIYFLIKGINLYAKV